MGWISFSLINHKYRYFSNEIIWGARFSQKAVLSRQGNVNIGSFGQKDMDKVIMEKNFPRESAQALAMIEEFEHTEHSKREASV